MKDLQAYIKEDIFDTTVKSIGDIDSLKEYILKNCNPKPKNISIDNGILSMDLKWDTIIEFEKDTVKIFELCNLCGVDKIILDTDKETTLKLYPQSSIIDFHNVKFESTNIKLEIIPVHNNSNIEPVLENLIIECNKLRIYTIETHEHPAVFKNSKIVCKDLSFQGKSTIPSLINTKTKTNNAFITNAVKVVCPHWDDTSIDSPEMQKEIKERMNFSKDWNFKSLRLKMIFYNQSPTLFDYNRVIGTYMITFTKKGDLIKEKKRKLL